MRTLLIVALFVNAALLAGRFWQELSVVAEVGRGGTVVDPCATDHAKYSLDTNGDNSVDLSDFVYGLNWFFQGSDAPKVCLAGSSDLEMRVSFLESVVESCFPDVNNDMIPDCAQPGIDVDGDGFIAPQDCDDNDASINPDATEVCDGVDNDCDGTVDDGVLATFYRDDDGDNFGDDTQPIQACAQPPGFVTDNTDCDDGNPQRNPGATEFCDAIDNDCDGTVDDNVSGTSACLTCENGAFVNQPSGTPCPGGTCNGQGECGG